MPETRCILMCINYWQSETVTVMSDKSQGNLLIHLSCEGIFNSWIITNLLLSLQWKNFEDWSIFDEVTGKKVNCITCCACCGTVLLKDVLARALIIWQLLLLYYFIFISISTDVTFDLPTVAISKWLNIGHHAQRHFFALLSLFWQIFTMAAFVGFPVCSVDQML